MRAQFAFYKSFDDVYQDLNDNQRLEFMRIILDVQFLRIKVDDVSFKDVILKHIWNAQKHSIQKSIRGYLESQKSSTVKEPYFGVYDTNNIPLPIPSEGVRKEEEEKEEGEGEYTLIENEFQSLWRGYTLKFLKTKKRQGGSKKKAKDKYISLRKKYDKKEILKMVKVHMSQKIGHKDLERLLQPETLKQFIEDKESNSVPTLQKEIKILNA